MLIFYTEDLFQLPGCHVQAINLAANISWLCLLLKAWFGILGYRAVICGMDPVCCESKSWIDGANVDKLTRGPDQPFYQV